MLIKFETWICLCLVHWLTTMESVYGLGRRDTLCVYVNHGGYILSWAVLKRPRLAPLVRSLRLHKLKLTNPVFFSSDYRTAQRLADWWDEWKIGLRKVLLETTKTARQGLMCSYRQRLKRLYVRMGAALLKTRSSANSLECDQAIRDRPTSVDTPAVLRQNVA